MRAALIIVALLVGCAPKAEYIMPPDVTPAEIAIRDDCIQRITKDWPVDSPLIRVEFVRIDAATAIALNITKKGLFDENGRAMAKRGAKYAGACYLVRGKFETLYQYSDFAEGKPMYSQAREYDGWRYTDKVLAKK